MEDQKTPNRFFTSEFNTIADCPAMNGENILQNSSCKKHYIYLQEILIINPLR